MKIKQKKQKNPKSFLFFVLFCVLSLYFLLLIFPILWALMNSLKSYDEYTIFENIIGFPQELTFSSILQNYKNAWTYGFGQAVEDGKMFFYTIPQQFMHSILYSGGCTAASILVTSVTAYVVARYDYKFSKVIYNVFIVTMILPLYGAMQSELLLTKALGIFDTFWGVWLLKANFMSGGFLIWYSQFKMISKEYTEAALMDGASHFAIMTRVIFPLAKGTFGTMALLNFVGYWNDYSVPMVYLPSKPTLALGMFQFSNRLGAVVSSVPVKISYMLVVALPIIIIFLLFHKRLMGNLTMGGLKG